MKTVARWFMPFCMVALMQGAVAEEKAAEAAAPAEAAAAASTAPSPAALPEAKADPVKPEGCMKRKGYHHGGQGYHGQGGKGKQCHKPEGKQCMKKKGKHQMKARMDAMEAKLDKIEGMLAELLAAQKGKAAE